MKKSLDKNQFVKIEINELILLYDSWLNYQAALCTIYKDEHMFAAKRKIIKAIWENVPEKFAENTVACAQHMVEEIYGIKVED